MLRLTVLGSGSRGNAIVVEGSHGRLLVDAGFGVRALARRLGAAGVAPASIDALVVTHEHTDHASGALDAVARWGWRLAATQGTLAALGVGADQAGAASGIASLGYVPSAIGGLRVEPIPVPHDASEPVALVISDERSGFRVGIALDLGAVPETLVTAFDRLDLLVVEANHDRAMLHDGPYPDLLKRRIAGGRGHLSNDGAAALAARCAHRGLAGVVLAHLSETNNTPAQAMQTVGAALHRSGWRRRTLHAAAQGAPSGPYAAGPGPTASDGAQQLTLGLR
jgi:phosphoribosyl 1,2-cyclic phosphodiesterase